MAVVLLLLWVRCEVYQEQLRISLSLAGGSCFWKIKIKPGKREIKIVKSCREKRQVQLYLVLFDGYYHPKWGRGYAITHSFKAKSQTNTKKNSAPPFTFLLWIFTVIPVTRTRTSPLVSSPTPRLPNLPPPPPPPPLSNRQLPLK